jgi:hypothetical protein
VDKKKVTKKLDVQELERRKAPFASPLLTSGDEGGASSVGTESVGGSTFSEPEPDVVSPDPTPTPRSPRLDRI